MPWFFNYAELGPQEIVTLLGKAPLCALPATLPSHRVAFKGNSRKWGGALASLEKSRKSIVYGSALLVTEDELKQLVSKNQNLEATKVNIILEATQDKVAAFTTFVNSPDYGTPSDELTRAILKHLKFFWGQQGSGKPSLTDFGISTELKIPKKKKEPAEEKPESPKKKSTTRKRRTRSKAK